MLPIRFLRKQSNERTLIYEKAGAKLGYVEESRMIAEMAIGAYRAGASVYITYFAEEIAGLMDSGVIG